MAKPSTSSRAPRNAPQRKEHRYIDALISDDFGRHSKLTIQSANSFAKKKLDAASQSLQLRNEQQQKKARRIEVRDWRNAEHYIAAELRDNDRRSRALWRSLNTKVRPDQKVRHTPPRERKRAWPFASFALPKYDGPVIDRNRQRGVFMRMRYYSRKTAKAGVSQRVALYCYHGAELDEDGNPYLATNVGYTIEEALCGFDHLEQINWAAQKNAKLLMHGILAVDHRQSPDEMMACGVRWAEGTLGRFDLPYLVTLHAPPPDGDQRNWHVHILWCYRPMVRTGDHEWDVGEMLRTDLDNPKAMKAFREMFAAVMTEMSYEAGQNQVWTAKSNADRGLPHEPQVHLGGAKTNMARNGEFVAENEDNHERVMRSKAAVIDDALRHADVVLTKAHIVACALIRRIARLPMLAMPVPQRVAPALMSVNAEIFNVVPPLSMKTIFVPAVPPIRPEATRLVGSMPVREQNIARRATAAVSLSGCPAATPRPARIEIANLRNWQLPPLASNREPNVKLPAIAKPATMSKVPFSTQSPMLRSVYKLDQSIEPPRLVRPIIPQLSEFATSWTRPDFADTDTLERVLARIEAERKRDEKRRNREEETSVRAAQAAEAAASQQATIQPQPTEPRAGKSNSRKNAWHLARAKRLKAMIEWDEAERPVGGALRQPGRAIEGPGEKQEDKNPSSQSPFPRWPGQGVSE